MAQDKTIHINVKMDEKAFRDFAWYHTVLRTHKPLIYAAFFLVMGGACLYLALKSWWVPVGILLAATVLVPALRGWQYSSSMRREVAAQRLNQQRPVYTVELSASGILVRNSGERSDFSWKDITAFLRMREYFYLYSSPTQCFILPYSQFLDAVPAEVWAMAKAAAPDKCRDCSHGKAQ